MVRLNREKSLGIFFLCYGWKWAGLIWKNVVARIMWQVVIEREEAKHDAVISREE